MKNNLGQAAAQRHGIDQKSPVSHMQRNMKTNLFCYGSSMNQLRRIYWKTSAMFVILLISPLVVSEKAYGAIQCYQCHGTQTPIDYRPLDSAYRNPSSGGFQGNHRTHMSANAVQAACAKCHPGSNMYTSSHRDGKIKVSSRINNSLTTTYYPSYNNNTSAFTQTATPSLGSCTNVNCHFEAPTPVWGNTPLVYTSPAVNDCYKCHGAAPSDGSHPAASGSGKKHGNYYGTTTASCVKCHSDHTAESLPFAHATSAGNRGLVVSFAAAPNNGFGRYTGNVSYPKYLPSQSPPRNGTCKNLYCHSPGTKASNPDLPNTTAQWGGSLTCTGCHKADNASGSTITSGSHYNHIFGAAGFSQIKCVKCHAATATAGMAIADVSRHVNGQVNLAFDSSSSAANGSYNGSLAKPSSPSVKTPGSAFGNCQNVYCHSAGQADGGTWPPVYTSPTWGNAASGKCGTCHGVTGSDTHGDFSNMMVQRRISTGSHKKHLGYAYGISDSDMQCAICHAGDKTQFTSSFSTCGPVCHNGNANTAVSHANYAINVNIANLFGATATYNGSTKPGSGYSTCGNTYCHSDGQATPVTYAAPKWGDPTTAQCGSCHGANATTPPTSARHARHVGNAYPYEYACALCHNGIVKHNANSSTYALISSGTANSGAQLHVNKSRDVYFDTFNSFGHYSSANLSCNSAYCHSIGNTSVATGSLPGVYNGKIYAKPKWTDAGPLACNSCHGRSTSNGMPDYANAGAPGSATANSHQKHVMSSAIACVECHEKTTKTGTTIRSTFPSRHVDGTTHDVYFNLSGLSPGGTYNNSSKTCSSTYCHGTGPSLAWGGTTFCNSCHSANAGSSGGGGVNNWGAAPVNAHKMHIEETTLLPSKYTNYSAGNLSSGATTYRFGCASCHNPTQASHVSGYARNPYRAQVFFGFTSPGKKPFYTYTGTHAGTADNGFAWSNANTACTSTYCHSNGAGGTGNTEVSWATTAKSAAATRCRLCHGDATSNNLSGKHRAHVNNDTTFGTNNSFGCKECHAKTVMGNNTSISNKVNHVNKLKDYSGARAYGPSHYNTATKQCTNIYCHSNGNPVSLVFVSMTGSRVWNGNATFLCNGCHGRSNPATGTPDYPNGGAPSNTANSHPTHVTKLNIVDTTGCAVCHRKTIDASTVNKFRNFSTLHLSGSRDVTFNSTKTGVNSSWTAGSATCNSVVCHSNGRGTFQATPPRWGETDNCGYCHPIASLGGAHAKHIDLSQTVTFYTYTANRSTVSTYNFGCSNCHPLANTKHASGTIMLDFRPSVAGIGTLRQKNSAAITSSGPAGTTNGGTTADSATNSVVKCLNVYCHSNGYAANTVYATTPDWYGSGFSGDKCAGCHGNSPNSTIAGSPAHYSNNFLGQGVTGGHVVGIHYDTIFTGTVGLAAAGTSNTSGHGNAGTSTTINCNICHYATVTSSSNDKNVVCTSCHNGTQATLRGDAAISNKSIHVNGVANVSFNPINVLSKAQMLNGNSVPPYSDTWTRNGGYKNAGSYEAANTALDTATMWNSATKTCSNVSCHNGQTVNWGSTNGSTRCQSCHTDM